MFEERSDFPERFVQPVFSGKLVAGRDREGFVYHERETVRAVRRLSGVYVETGFEDGPSIPLVGYFGLSNPEFEGSTDICGGTLLVAPRMIYGECEVTAGFYQKRDDGESIRIQARPLHSFDCGKRVELSLTYDLDRVGKTDIWQGVWSLDKSLIEHRAPPRGLIRCEIKPFDF